MPVIVEPPKLTRRETPKLANRLLERVRETYRQARSELLLYVAFCVGRTRAWWRFSREVQMKLEIGATRRTAKAGFLTTDMLLDSHYPCDLRLGLPFPGEAFELIYAEHVFEHFRQEELLFILRDCYRALRPGGVLSIAVPDAKRYVETYLSPGGVDPEEWCRWKHALRQVTPIDLLNYIFYMDGHHHYMFDETALVALLIDAGFERARIRAYDPGLDQQARQYESIYAEAHKTH